MRPVREAGEERAAKTHAYHLPEVVAVDEVAVLVDGLGLEHEAARLDEMALVAPPRNEDLAAVLVRHHHLHPGLDDVERAGGEVVPDLVVRDDDVQLHRLAGLHALRRDHLDGHGRTRLPLVGDLGHVDLAAQPGVREAHLLFGPGQPHGGGDVLVGAQEAVAAVLAVRWGAVVVEVVAAGGVERGLQRHMALAALDRLLGLARVVPPALAPVVVLVLELHPAHVVDLLVDELLVAGPAELRALEAPVLQALDVLLRVGADQEVRDELRRLPVVQLEHVALGLRDGVVCIALHVGLLDGVAGDARDALVEPHRVRQLVAEEVLRAGEERDGIVAAAAVARRLGAVLLAHHGLHGAERRVHRRPAVRAHLPLLVDLPVAPPARGRAAQRAGVEGVAGGRLRQARRKRPVGAVEVVVVLRQRVVQPHGIVGVDGQRRDHAQPEDEPRRAGAEGALRGQHRAHRLGPRPHVPPDDRPHVRQRRRHERERRDDVREVPSRTDPRAEERLPGQHQPARRRCDGGGHGEVAGEHDVRQRHLPVDAPVAELIPGVRAGEGEPGRGVQEHHPLVRHAERQQVDRQPRQRLEHQQPGYRHEQPVAPLAHPRVRLRARLHGRNALIKF